MILNVDDCGEFTELHADVCVIGGGAAGITLTRVLLDAGRRVILLESGGLDQHDRTDELMEGTTTGFPYYPLKDSRLRFFGGTTSIWGGRCAEMDEIDFTKRDWVAHSGWPIQKSDLQSYYQRAMSILELNAMPEGENFWSEHGLKDPGFDRDRIQTSLWQFDTKADRFAAARHQDLFDAPHAQIVLHANVTNIRTNEAGDRVEFVEFASLGGQSGRALADTVVLAAGGIENPRLLLASRDVHENGIGNDRDLVGRFFMEHPHARGARIESSRVLEALQLLPHSYIRNDRRYAVVGRPAARLQAELGLLNSSFTIGARQHPGSNMVLGKKVFMQLKHDLRPSRMKRSLWHFFRKQILHSRESLGARLGALQVRRGHYGLYTVIRAEQSPNPDSRVSLSSTKRDVLGVPTPLLDWQFQEIDKRTVAGSMQALGEELQRLGLGTLTLDDWLEDPSLPWKTDPLISNHPIGGYHHMGATRMAASPDEGVVDGDGRVFGVANLYVAGSSVFTTSGWANPTLTILALTLRLADHLIARSA